MSSIQWVKMPAYTETKNFFGGYKEPSIENWDGKLNGKLIAEVIKWQKKGVTAEVGTSDGPEKQVTVSSIAAGKKFCEDYVNKAKAKDTVQSVPTNDPERALALAKHEEGLTESQDRGKAKDVLPVPIKTSSLVPLPSGERNEVAYAADVSPDDMTLPELEKEIDSLLSKDKRTKLEEARLRFLTDAEMDKKRRATKSTDGRSRDRGRYVKMRDSKDKAKVNDMIRTDDKRRAADMRVSLPLQRSGSEPADHLFRAAQYEIGGDRTRALDSYRAAASGFRKANDRANEQKARDGIMFCQSAFDTQYDHPGIGRVRVCDSADVALRTALERTRAGEAVRVDGRTVRPGRSRVGDAEGERKIARWESRSGKHWVDLYFNPAFKLANGNTVVDAHYRAPSAGGGVQASTEAEAIAAMQRKVDQGYFQPDAAKSPMKRVTDDTGGPPPVDNPATPAMPDPVPTDDSAFSKLEHKLEAKGESKKEAGGVAYKVGAEKYGKAGMAKKAAEGRSKARDSKREVLPV